MKSHGKDIGKKAASQLDIPVARSSLVRLWRELFLGLILEPALDFYMHRRSTGREDLVGVKGPVILVANHRSHIDTPVILTALPRRLRRRLVVGAAADYFYTNKLVEIGRASCR